MIPTEPAGSIPPTRGSSGSADPSHDADQKRAAEVLRRFSLAMDSTEDSIYLVDRASMSFFHVNDAACRTQGCSREQLLALDPWTPLSLSRAELEATYDALIGGGAPSEPIELLRRRRDGSQAWVELRRNAHLIGDRWTIVTLARDITEQKNAALKLRRANRMYAMLSSTSSLILRERNPRRLFETACDIAVNKGGFRLAWIGLIEGNAAATTPVASAGVAARFLSAGDTCFSLDGDVGMRASVNMARAVAEKRAIVCNEIAAETSAILTGELIEHGLDSMVILPLIVSGKVTGLLCLYAGESEFFDAEELALLEELAGNIAFATDHIAKAEALSYIAYHDPLTGLANRVSFNERLEHAVANAAAARLKVGVVLLDIERFKTINDTLGWKAGDELLKQVASRLTAYASNIDRVARIGPDCFAILVPGLSTAKDLSDRIGERSSEVFGLPFRIDGTDLRIAAKVAVAIYPESGVDAATVIRNAEAALKIAKNRGERSLFYTPSMNAHVAEKLVLQNDLQRALQREEFVLHYQPKVDVASGKLTGAEALIRWNHPRDGLIMPGHFVAILEETGLIREVGRWVLRQAIADYRRWIADRRPVVRIAVNVSPVQLRNRAFTKELMDAIGVDSPATGALELEITESVIMANVTHSIRSLQAIRAMGITVAIDDFGTGFSSLSYLSKLPVDTLKIDRSFVTDMLTGSMGLALVSTVINLGHALNLKVVAEGVETEEQARLLRLLKCNEMQGFLVSNPLPREFFEAEFLAL